MRSSVIDLARGFAILAVVMLHTGFLPFSRFTGPLLSAWMVPVFVLTGGWFLKTDEKNFLFVRRKVLYFLGAYFLFALFGFLSWLVLRHGYASGKLSQSFTDMLMAGIWGYGLDYNGPLWFFIAYLLALLLTKILLQAWMTFHLSGKVIVIVFLMSISFLLMEQGVRRPWSYDIVPLFSAFIFVGLLAKIHAKHIPVNRVCWIFAGTIYLAGTIWNGDSDIFGRTIHIPVLFISNALFGSYFIILTARFLSRRKLPFLHWFTFLGRHSLLIFALHWPLMQWLTYSLAMSGIIQAAHTEPTLTGFLFIDKHGAELRLLRLFYFILYTLFPIMVCICYLRLRHMKK